jgi:NET1-associated nuclear protein 1 (U3 small nucleolar RNA-associated protein 17)
VLFDLEVAPSNRIARRDEKELEPVAVELVAFSGAGPGESAAHGQSEWMATIEGRQGDEYEGAGAVCNLKVWRWDGAR